MQIVVRCNETQKEELVSNGIQAEATLVWVYEKEALLTYKQADAVIDLLFDNEKETIEMLQQLDGIRIVNNVLCTLQETDRSFVRINGWPTFLKAHTLEASATHEDLKKLAETVFSCFHKTVAWLPDEPGFVTPRIVSMIINEAYLALAEGVSTRAEIDTAMKLGTAYPFGPFEWSEAIGVKNIAALLARLSQQQTRYTPAPLLVQQAAVI